MARLVTFAACCLTVGAACALYGLKYDTREIEARVHAQERSAEKTESDIAVLKAERAYLGRPARIETLARQQGLAPIGERQYERQAWRPERAGTRGGPEPPADTGMAHAAPAGRP